MNGTDNLADKDKADLWSFLVSLNNSKCKLNEIQYTTKKSTTHQMDAFFYIVVVLAFYASSIVLLLIKYARKDDEEKFLNNQFAEFVKRDKFNGAQYKNSIALVRTKEILATLDESRNGVPTIKVHSCSVSDESGQKGCNISNPATDEGVNDSPSHVEDENECKFSEDYVTMECSSILEMEVFNNYDGHSEGLECGMGAWLKTETKEDGSEALYNTPESEGNGTKVADAPEDNEFLEIV